MSGTITTTGESNDRDEYVAQRRPERMRAVGLYRSLPIDHPESLLDVEVPKPAPGERDLLVAIKAIAVNPVDYKVR